MSKDSKTTKKFNTYFQVFLKMDWIFKIGISVLQPFTLG